MKKERESVTLRVITMKGGSAICETESGREVAVNFQNIPFEIEVGDSLEAIVYYKNNGEIQSIIVTQRS